jgi:hypothetical protein
MRFNPKNALIPVASLARPTLTQPDIAVGFPQTFARIRERRLNLLQFHLTD